MTSASTTGSTDTPSNQTRVLIRSIIRMHSACRRYLGDRSRAGRRMGAGGYPPKEPLAKPDEGPGTSGSVLPGTNGGASTNHGAPEPTSALVFLEQQTGDLECCHLAEQRAASWLQPGGSVARDELDLTTRPSTGSKLWNRPFVVLRTTLGGQTDPSPGSHATTRPELVRPRGRGRRSGGRVGANNRRRPAPAE